ncbi:malto-oligosyltrehalose trehalohydrolase [Mucilaginibacter sp.]|uniref:malto-oligosyltrehalose trehalohydrolase n=1 Tax=Mucilaginibacter sp. TaxID=1882438 RepID=UPI003D0C347C
MIDKRTVGVNFDEQGVAQICLWAPTAREVSLRLANSKADLLLEKTSFGYWDLTSLRLKPGDTYHFVLDGKALPDPASLSQPEGVHGPSQAINLHNFAWEDSKWKNPPQDDYIIYELHTGTFTPEGNFAGIEAKLDYLIELGITAIEIMPVAQFPGDRNWGYDGVFPFAVQNSYGGSKALMHLVNACHQKNLAVILDVVYNHIGPDGNYLGEYGPYFTQKYKTPWGNAINFDDAGCDAVRRYFIENVLMWFRDFHIDALRMDAVHALKDFSPKHILQEIKEETDKLMALTGKAHYLLIEFDLNDHRFIDPIKKCGYGADAQWIDEFHHALRVTAGGEQDGYYSDFKSIADLAKSYRDAYVYDGVYSSHRDKVFGNKASGNPGNQFIVFSQNHDQVGNRMLGERSSQLFSFEMQKLMAAAVMVSPYLPLLFMGEEWSAQSPFQFFVSHTDPELAEVVRKGRKEEFASFHNKGEAPDPQAKETFERSKLQWDKINNVMLNYYKTLIALRKSLPALSNLNRANLSVSCNQEQQTLILQRWHQDQKVCCLMNFSERELPIHLPEKEDWKVVLNSADAKWVGINSSTQNMQPQSIIIYTN